MTDNVEKLPGAPGDPELLRKRIMDSESNLLDLGDCLKSLRLIAYNVLDYSNDHPENDQVRYLLKKAEEELEAVRETLWPGEKA